MHIQNDLFDELISRRRQPGTNGWHRAQGPSRVNFAIPILSQMPAPAVRYRFVNIEDLMVHAHNANWIPLRAKQFEAGEVYW